MPLISIIVPYYNRSNCLLELIESVLAQTHQNWELLIVDDCSDDSEAAMKIISDIADSRIIYKRHANNKNGAQARNTGIDMSAGEYIAFLDSDDQWVYNKLELQLMQVMQSKSPGKTLLFSALEKVFVGQEKNNKILPKMAKLETESVSDYLFANDGLMQTSTFFLSQKLAKQIRFNPNLPRHQDYDFVLRAESFGVIFSYSEIPLCQWVCLPGDGNVSKKGAGLLFSIKWYEEYEKFMTKTGARAYLSKQMFYIAVKNRSLGEYYRYAYKRVGFIRLAKVLFANIMLVINK